jgi:hydrogenase expression/formation protein HypC
MCVAVPLKVKRVEADRAVLEAGLGELLARTDLVVVREGDYVLVHAGFVIEKIDPEEARKTLEMFREIASGGR